MLPTRANPADCAVFQVAPDPEETAAGASTVPVFATPTAGAAHDLGNLLQIIGGACLLLRKGGPLEPNIGAIEKAAERGAELLRHAGGHALGRAVPLDVAEYLKTWRNGLVAVIEGVRLHVVCEAGAVVRIIPGDLGRVLLNLAINATQAMRGQERVRLLVISARRDGAEVCITCRDTGPGMEEATRVQVFDRGFTTKGGGNCGLGLANVRELITNAGGSISVESTQGMGTTFTVRLPSA